MDDSFYPVDRIRISAGTSYNFETREKKLKGLRARKSKRKQEGDIKRLDGMLSF